MYTEDQVRAMLVEAAKETWRQAALRPQANNSIAEVDRVALTQMAVVDRILSRSKPLPVGERCGAIGGGEHQHKTHCARPKGHEGPCDP